MGEFVRHESCSNCGSRDNFARYDDGGGFCFGCHHHEPATHAPMRKMGSNGDSDWQERGVKPLPDDIGHHFRNDAVEWLASFHVDVPTAIKHGLVWSPKYEQLIYQLGDCWQARNFNEERKRRRKNYTSGDVNGCLHIYGSVEERSRGVVQGTEEKESGVHETSTSRLVIVEDPVSALRISPWCDAMPLLGSHLATARLTAVAKLYSSLTFWLDSDKWKEATVMADRAKLLGLSTRVIWTELDPKCFPDEELKEYLK